MTIIELIVGIIVAGIIFPALTEAVLIGLRTLDNTNTRIAGSNDTLLVASYFTGDVEGASSVASGGTRAHVTPSVTLSPSVTNVALVLLYAVRGATTVVAPPTSASTTIWNTSAGGLTSASADEALTINADNRSDTLARVATTPIVTSSITHTIALIPTGKLTRYGAATAGATANTLALTEDSAVGTNDVLIAHITAATSAANVLPPTGWTEINRQDLSTNLTSIAYYVHGPIAAHTSWTWRFPAGQTHDIAGGIVGYTNIASGPPANSAVSTNPCGGETPVLSVTTADNFAASSVGYYFLSSAGENQLVRRECTGAAVSAIQVLARQLQTASAAVVTCVPVGCDPLPAAVTLRLNEVVPRNEVRGRSYVLSARSRTG